MGCSPRIDAPRLADFATAVYAGAGLPEADARLVADTLVQADLWGHQSHGVLRLGWYLDRLRHGVMHSVTTPEVVIDAGAIAVIDGHDGVGQVLAMRATQEAIQRARAHGIGAVAVRNSNHFGTCMYLMIAMDIAKFQPLEQFTARMAAFADEIKAVPLATGFDEVLYPGEIEDNNDAKFRREGLALPEETMADLRRIARHTGLEAKFPG